MPSSWRAKTGRPWWPDWVISAIAGPSRSSRKRSKALRLVLGPSSRSPERLDGGREPACAAAPSSPVSAKPEAKTTANFDLGLGQFLDHRQRVGDQQHGEVDLLGQVGDGGSAGEAEDGAPASGARGAAGPRPARPRRAAAG